MCPSDVGLDLLGGQRLGDGVKRRLGILDDQKPRRAEGDDPLANLGPDRAAAAGDNHGLVFHQGFQPRIVDGGTRPQQQVFDRDRRKARRFTAFQRWQAAHDQPQAPGTHHEGFRMRFRVER